MSSTLNITLYTINVTSKAQVDETDYAADLTADPPAFT